MSRWICVGHMCVIFVHVLVWHYILDIHINMMIYIKVYVYNSINFYFLDIRLQNVTPPLDLDNIIENRSILEQQKLVLHLLDITSRLFKNLVDDIGGEMLQMVRMFTYKYSCIYIDIYDHIYIYIYTYW
jgi:hypothetical protein